MTDREFLDTFITERMQMHYSASREKPTQEEMDDFRQREKQHDQAMKAPLTG